MLSQIYYSQYFKLIALETYANRKFSARKSSSSCSSNWGKNAHLLWWEIRIKQAKHKLWVMRRLWEVIVWLRAVTCAYFTLQIIAIRSWICNTKSNKRYAQMGAGNWPHLQRAPSRRSVWRLWAGVGLVVMKCWKPLFSVLHETISLVMGGKWRAKLKVSKCNGILLHFLRPIFVANCKTNRRSAQTRLTTVASRHRSASIDSELICKTETRADGEEQRS